MGDSATIRTRFAPSPSGHLHVGGARTALFCWAYARAHGGTFLVRLEDTDRKRSSEASSLGMLDDLLWLGIAWDEGPSHGGCGGGETGPYRQSERLEHYRAAVDRLIESGHAYRAFETPEELDAARATARAADRPYRYDRAALQLDPATVGRYLAEGRPHVVRFRVPEDREIVVRDEVLGEVRTASSELDDFVLFKADGYPTYHFAVVVDDELMGVTHVIRGQEHLNNTARHVLIQEALGFAAPVYAHLSLIFNPDGSKMSKRDKDKALRAEVRRQGLTAPPAGAGGEPAVDPQRWSLWLGSAERQLDLDDAMRLSQALGIHLPEIDVDDFRRAGYLPEVLVNYLALLGWSPGGDVEKFDRAFLLEHFDLDRVIRSPARFDRDKLLAFNLDALQVMEPQRFRELYREHCSRYHPEFPERLSAEAFDLLATANQARSKTLDDQIESSRFFIIDDDAVTYQPTKAVRKALCKGEPCGYDHLEGVLPVLEATDRWEVESLESVVGAYAEQHAGDRLGAVAQPLRVALSGGTVSPAIWETLVILGRDAVLARVHRCLAQRGAFCGAAEG